MSLTCPKCNYNWEDEQMNYCKNCGTYLHNYCSNPECDLNDTDEPVELNPNDCFCPECGAKTTFYSNGLIEPDLK